MLMSLDNFVITFLKVVELESLDDQSSELRLKISVLQKENTDLKDRNDELTTQLETLASKALQRRLVHDILSSFLIISLKKFQFIPLSNFLYLKYIDLRHTLLKAIFN
jgi:hypothetical protein